MSAPSNQLVLIARAWRGGVAGVIGHSDAPDRAQVAEAAKRSYPISLDSGQLIVACDAEAAVALGRFETSIVGMTSSKLVAFNAVQSLLIVDSDPVILELARLRFEQLEA